MKLTPEEQRVADAYRTLEEVNQENDGLKLTLVGSLASMVVGSEAVDQALHDDWIEQAMPPGANEVAVFGGTALLAAGFVGTSLALAGRINNWFVRRRALADSVYLPTRQPE